MDDTTYELVVFDGDETLIDGDIVDALAEHVGVTDEVTRVKTAVWEDDLDAMEALSEQIFPLFEGVSAAELDRLVQSLPFAPGARAVASNVTCQTAIFTALTPLADHIADELEFDWKRANDPVVEDGVLTGEIRGDIIDRGKGPVLDDLLEQLGIDHEQVIAVGDGPHDIPLFERAGFSIAMDPGAAVRDVPDVATDEQNFFEIVPHLEARGVLDVEGVQRHADGPVDLTVD
jgi:phosphoserine phosphatase